VDQYKYAERAKGYLIALSADDSDDAEETPVEETIFSEF
jgi:hypothetical protein